jgi:hypothetical protein
MAKRKSTIKDRIRNYMFDDYLDDNEDILFIAHRHIFVMIRDFSRLLVMHAALPFAVWLFFPQMFWIYIAWGAIGIIRVLLLIQDWYYDCWLVTNFGVIGVEWTGYFERASDRVEYQSIEGVSYKIKGVIPTMFNYGNITLAKLGGPSTVTLKDCNNPKRTEKNIVKYQEKFLTKKNFTDQEVLKRLLSDLVATHVKNHGVPEELQNKKKLEEFVKKET